MLKKRNIEKKWYAILAGFIYTITALIVVVSAWVIGLHRFDLSYTISLYVAFRPWTAILYGICGFIMVTFLNIYIFKINISKFKKVIYFIISTSVLGCTLFPYNDEWNAFVAEIHNLCATILFLMIAIAFIIMLVKPKDKKQRIFAIVAVLFVVYYIMCYFMVNWIVFNDLLFIWENIFIYFLLGMLIIEDDKK